MWLCTCIKLSIFTTKKRKTVLFNEATSEFILYNVIRFNSRQRDTGPLIGRVTSHGPNGCFGRTAAPSANQIVSPLRRPLAPHLLRQVVLYAGEWGPRAGVEQLLGGCGAAAQSMWQNLDHFHGHCWLSLSNTVFLFCVLTWPMSSVLTWICEDQATSDGAHRLWPKVMGCLCSLHQWAWCPRHFLKVLMVFHTGLKISDIQACELWEGFLVGCCWSPEECPLGGERSCSTLEGMWWWWAARCVMTASCRRRWFLSVLHSADGKSVLRKFRSCFLLGCFRKMHIIDFFFFHGSLLYPEKHFAQH